MDEASDSACGDADDVDIRCARQQGGPHTVETRDRPRPSHANLGKFGDVLLHRFGIAAGPAGDHELLDIQAPRNATHIESDCMHFATPQACHNVGPRG